MKAVVVEIRGTKAAVLSDDGCITTIRNREYEIGQVIIMEKKRSRLPRLMTAAAAAAVVLTVSAAGAYAWMTPYSYVSMDVNPSVEYTLNRFDRVLSVRAVNDDATQVLAEASIRLDDLKGKTVEEALTATIRALDSSEREYFQDGEGNVVIAAWCKDVTKAEKLAQKLEKSAAKDLEDKEDVKVEGQAVGQERVEQAKKLQEEGVNVTPGRLNLLEKLDEARGGDGKLSDKEVAKLLDEDLSVKEIMQEVKEAREEAKENGKDTAPGQQKKEDASGKDDESGDEDEDGGKDKSDAPSKGKDTAPGQEKKNAGEDASSKEDVPKKDKPAKDKDKTNGNGPKK